MSPHALLLVVRIREWEMMLEIMIVLVTVSLARLLVVGLASSAPEMA